MKKQGIDLGEKDHIIVCGDFGHYHMELNVDEKHSLLYHAIVSVEEHNTLADIPVIGSPGYRHKDMVRFQWDDIEKIGKILIVDAYGTSEQKEEPS